MIDDGSRQSAMTSMIRWYGCATFGLNSAGLSIMLDAYIDRIPAAAGPQPQLTAADIDDCDWIVIGHSHFDHLYGAERIMHATEARLIGSYETVRVLEQAGVPLDRMIPVAGGETVQLEGAKEPCTVTVYPSQHSCVWSHGQMDQPDHVCLGDLGVTWQEQKERFESVMNLLSDLGPDAAEHLAASMVGHSDRGDGGALIYRFDLPDGSLLYQDTSGHWSGVLDDLRPDVAILAAAGRGNIDGEPIQGSLAQFVARQVELLEVDRIILSHHDDWLPGFSIPTDTTPIAAAISAIRSSAQLVELDYGPPVALFG